MRWAALQPLVHSAALLAALSAALLAGPRVAVAEAWTDPEPDPALAEPAGPPAPAEPPRTERLGATLEKIGKDNPLLARVDGHEIRWADVVASARGLPDAYRSQIEAVFPALLERLIDLRLIAAAGRAAGLAEDQQVRRVIAGFEDRVIREAFVAREIAERITTAVLRARYEAYLDELAARTEVRARHILLEREADAVKVIAALDEGADFTALARDRSLGATAEQGGDLDYFTRDSMAPEFADAAFRLGIGEYSRVPHQTAFGWHVIKVEDRRSEAPRSFFRMRDQLRKEITREMMNDLLRGLRAKADIELYPVAARPR